MKNPNKEVIFFYADKELKAYVRKLAKKSKRSLSFCMNAILQQAKVMDNVCIQERN